MTIRRVVPLLFVIALLAYLVVAVSSLRPLVRTPALATEGCHLVSADGLIGAEDMEFDHQTGTLYIAAANRRSTGTFRPDPGAIFRWHPDDEAAPTKLPLQGMGEALRPHGIGFFIHPSGERRLFAVHHSPRGESVAIFRLDQEPGRQWLTLVRTVQAPHFVSINDVAASGLESFYVTNDHSRKPPWGHVLEDFAMLSTGSLVYFDGTSARAVASGLRYANGVQLSANQKQVLVAETTGYRIKIFARQDNGDLTQLGVTNLQTTPDNFSIDDHGDVLIGAHPSPFRFLRHAKSAASHAPSEVVQIKLSAEGAVLSNKTVLSEPGELFSASSVAVAHGSHLVIGGVFDRGVLHCPRR